MRTLKEIYNAIDDVSTADKQKIMDYLKEIQSVRTMTEIESIIRSGQLDNDLYLFLTTNSICSYENYKLQSINDRFAISILQDRFPNIKASNYLTKLPRLDITFNPGATERVYDGKFNLFTPSQYVLYANSIKKRYELDIDYIKSHFKHVYTLLKNVFRNDEYISYFINWFSTIINTRKKTGVAFIVKGVQGSGKNFLFDHLIKTAFYVSENAEYVLTLDNDRLRSQFKGGLEQSLFICFNEIKGDFRDNATTADTLKSLITDSKNQVERKGKDSQELHTFFNSIMFSNHSVPFQIEPGDRRFFVIETNNKKLDIAVRETLNQSMINYVKNFDEEADLFLKYIIGINYDVSLSRTALNTDEKESLINATTPRITRLGALIKNQDIETLYNEFIELYTPIKQSQESFNASLKLFLNDVKKGQLKLPSLYFAYEIFVSAKNDKTKIERDLAGEFGKTFRTGKFQGREGFHYKKVNNAKTINIDIDSLFKDNFEEEDICAVYDTPSKKEEIFIIDFTDTEILIDELMKKNNVSSNDFNSFFKAPIESFYTIYESQIVSSSNKGDSK